MTQFISFLSLYHAGQKNIVAFLTKNMNAKGGHGVLIILKNTAFTRKL